MLGTTGGCGGGGDNGDGGISASLGEYVDDAPRLLLDRGVGGVFCVWRTPCMGVVGGGGAGGDGGMDTELVLEAVGVGGAGESTRIESWKLGS